MDSPAVMKISFQDLILFPTDSEGHATYNTDLDSYTRTIQVVRFYVAINFSNNKYKRKKLRHARTSPQLDPLKLNTHIKSSPARPEHPEIVDDDDEIGESNDEEEYRKIRDNDFYFILPMDLLAHIGKNDYSNHDGINKPKSYVHIHMQEPLIMLANKLLIKYITCLNHHFSMMKTVQKNLHLRPLVTPRENAVVWWVYAIKAVVEDLKRGSDLARSSVWKILRMRRYIDLYKRKQDIVALPFVVEFLKRFNRCTCHGSLASFRPKKSIFGG